MEFEALDYWAGMVSTLLAVKFYVLAQCRRSLRKLLGRGGGGPMVQRMPLAPLSIPPDWIKSGSPIFQMCQYAEAADRRSSSGIWSCEGPASFEWQFDSDETVYVLEGSVAIEYLGQHFVLQAGGVAVFYAGSRALWSVPNYVRKSYLLSRPNAMLRWARYLVGVLRQG
jgi:uncharacterized cupin superfamily protein